LALMERELRLQEDRIYQLEDERDRLLGLLMACQGGSTKGEGKSLQTRPGTRRDEDAKASSEPSELSPPKVEVTAPPLPAAPVPPPPRDKPETESAEPGQLPTLTPPQLDRSGSRPRRGGVSQRDGDLRSILMAFEEEFPAEPEPLQMRFLAPSTGDPIASATPDGPPARLDPATVGAATLIPRPPRPSLAPPASDQAPSPPAEPPRAAQVEPSPDPTRKRPTWSPYR
jgi:hypothetical protein